jgi:hypothetical protein
MAISGDDSQHNGWNTDTSSDDDNGSGIVLDEGKSRYHWSSKRSPSDAYRSSEPTVTCTGHPPTIRVCVPDLFTVKDDKNAQDLHEIMTFQSGPAICGPPTSEGLKVSLSRTEASERKVWTVKEGGRVRSRRHVPILNAVVAGSEPEFKLKELFEDAKRATDESEDPADRDLHYGFFVYECDSQSVVEAYKTLQATRKKDTDGTGPHTPK